MEMQTGAKRKTWPRNTGALNHFSLGTEPSRIFRKMQKRIKMVTSCDLPIFMFVASKANTLPEYHLLKPHNLDTLVRWTWERGTELTGAGGCLQNHGLEISGTTQGEKTTRRTAAVEAGMHLRSIQDSELTGPQEQAEAGE